MRWLLALALVATPLSISTAKAPEMAVETHTLDNGLTLLMNRDARLPVVAVEVRYFVGSQHERSGRTGFAHLFEHLMFQGSSSYDDEYFKPFEPIGAKINGTTSNDRTNYYEQVPSNYLELVLWMESDRMENLLGALTQTKLDNQRDVVKNERRQNYEDRPYGMVWQALDEGLHPVGHPYHHQTIGSHADLSAATLDDVKAFFRRYYVPANACISISGDFDPEQAKALVQRYFGHLPAGQRAPQPDASFDPLKGITHRVIKDTKAKLPRVYLAWHSAPLYAPGDADMDILASVLSHGKSSRLYKPLVFEQKIAKDVVAFQYSRQLGSMFVIQATAAPGHSTDELSSALLTALKQALATPPTADELSRTLNGWRKSFFQRLESVLNRAQLIGTYFQLTGDPEYVTKDLARYVSVNADSAHAAAQSVLSTESYLRIDVVPDTASTAKEQP